MIYAISPAPVKAWASAHPILWMVLLTALFSIVGLAFMGDNGVSLGAVTLAEAAVASSNMLQRGVIQTFIDESPVLDRLPFMEIEGNAYQYTKESSLPGIAFRAVNAAYTESTGAVVNATVGLKIFGGDADVDRFIARTRGNLNDQRALQTRLKAKAASIFFTQNFFSGNSGTNADAFDGLQTILTGAQVIAAGTNGAALTLSMLDDMLAAVIGGADVIYANDWLIRKVNTLVRATGQVELETRESYGKLVRFYAGIPIIDPGLATDGTTRILPFTETQGTAVGTVASIYAVKFGEEEFVSGLTNGGIDVYDLGELETKPVYRTRIESYMAIGMFNGKAAARLKGVLQA